LVVSTFYAALQLVISFGLVLFPVNHWIYAGVILIILCIVYYLFIKRYYPLHEAYLKTKQL